MNINNIKTLLFGGLILLFMNMSAQNLTLDSCRNMALRHNKGSIISQETLLAAQDARKAAFTQFLPSFNAVGAYMYNSKDISLLAQDALLPVGRIGSDGNFTYSIDDIRTIDMSGVPVPINSSGQPTTNPNEFIPNHVAYLPKDAMTFDVSNVFALGIGFTQPIFMGGKIFALYKIAQSAENIASIKQNNDDINVMISVDEAYWRVVSLQKKVDLAEDYNELLKSTYNNVNELYKEGVVTNAELLKVQVKLNESEMSLVKAKNGLKLSKMYLNQICGMDFEQDYTLEDVGKIDEPVEISLDSVNQNIAQRPETMLLEENVKIAQSEVDIARSRFMPNIVAQGNYIMSNPNVFNGFDKSFKGMFSIGVGVTMPIFHFGERVHTLSMAKHNLRIAELTRDEAVEKMQLQVNMKNNSKSEAVKQNTMAENNMLQAEENLRQAQSGFDEGVISTTELMAAQTSWVSAKSEVIDARINLMITELYLNQSLGKVKVPQIDRTEIK